MEKVTGRFTNIVVTIFPSSGCKQLHVVAFSHQAIALIFLVNRHADSPVLKHMFILPALINTYTNLPLFCITRIFDRRRSTISLLYQSLILRFNTMWNICLYIYLWRHGPGDYNFFDFIQRILRFRYKTFSNNSS